MRHSMLLVVCLLSLLTGACASHGPASRVAHDEATQAREVFGDLERLEFAKQIQVQLPAKLGVVEMGSSGSSIDARRRQVTLQEALAEDREAFKDVVSVRPLTAPHGGGLHTLEQVRSQAASHQADLVLAFQRDERVIEGHNVGAIFKILLLPMLFLPTEENELHMDVRAVVMDTRNGLLYTTFDHHQQTTVSASEVGERSANREALDALFESAATRMREELGRKLRDLR